ncbi:AraC family transcriptional regulator [Burkholderia seminalis]|uniref:AraC family transcriptional regulator n=1 Tax=Burkholderia seminalis TaxID=488731 RepID=UPI001F165F06|nr:AraC family transcriptional regulator [Burkholderia seminalis]
MGTRRSSSGTVIPANGLASSPNPRLPPSAGAVASAARLPPMASIHASRQRRQRRRPSAIRSRIRVISTERLGRASRAPCRRRSREPMILSRRPGGYLRRFIDSVWASYPPFPIRNEHCRERVLPTGAVHLAIRLDADPLRLFDHAADQTGRTIGVAVIGGPRAAPYIKDVAVPVPTVGALIRPSAVRLVTGVPASTLYGLHLSLDDLWGAAASGLRDRLGEIDSAAARLDLWETLLTARLPRVAGIDPAIAESIAQLNRGTEVRAIVQQIGCSHRHFVARFRDAVGMPPKRYGRVRRFGQMLDGLSAEPAASWADAAALAGYADQPHFNREFLEFTGLSPEQYRRRASANGFHVPL